MSQDVVNSTDLPLVKVLIRLSGPESGTMPCHPLIYMYMYIYFLHYIVFGLLANEVDLTQPIISEFTLGLLSCGFYHVFESINFYLNQVPQSIYRFL